MQYRRLADSDRDVVTSFLLRDPVMNVVLLSNMERLGLEQGDTPRHGDYVGGRGEAGFQAVGALYNLGAFFFRAESPEAVSGMAGCVAETGRLPLYAAGTRSHVEVFLEELTGLATIAPGLIASEYMVLRASVADVPRACAARAAQARGTSATESLRTMYSEAIRPGAIVARPVSSSRNTSTWLRVPAA